MGSIYVKDFNGGLDNRRLPETTAGGVLLTARNGHITRGGEFEQRAAFVPEYILPSGTVGMFYDNAGLVVFGSPAAPALPSGVRYQRLVHPDGIAQLASILSADLYRGKVYAVGKFTDDSIYHFYDGVRVTDWFDGRAAARFTLVSGATTPSATTIDDIKVNGVSIISAPVVWTGAADTTATAVAAAINSHTSSPDYAAIASGPDVIVKASLAGPAANGRVLSVTATGTVVSPAVVTLDGGSAPVRAPGTFTVTGGGTGAGTKATTTFTVTRNTSQAAASIGMTALTLDGVAVIGAGVQQGASDTAFAANIAAAINSHASTPDYTATSSGNTVTIQTATNTANVNGKSLVPTMASGRTFTSGGAMAGGAGAFTSQFTDVKVNGVSIIASPVTWATSNAATASALAAAINGHTSSPDYTATASGATISLVAAVPSAVPDGAAVVFTMADGMTVDPTSLVLPNTPTVYEPGDFVQTIGQKMYATSGSVMHFSGIRAPTKWTTDTVGAGFIDMSEESSGSEALTGLARYQNYVAVFAERAIQIWYIDPDPTLNRQSQVLNNTGTASPNSITAFGDTDIFYLDESGLRSLRARDSSNAAATTDIGIPVDLFVTSKLATLTDEERRLIFGLIEPVNGRFWLIMRDQVFVFSYFPGSKISAWSSYDLTFVDENGTDVVFRADAALTMNRRVYIRSGDTVFVYSGLSGVEYDTTEAEAWLPYLDGNEPARVKQITGLDVACRGTWVVAAAMQTTNEQAEDRVATVFETTYDQAGRVPLQHQATHVSLRFRSSGIGPHKLASCAIHFDGKEKAG